MSPAAPRLTRGLLAILAFTASVGPFAVDMYLPAFTDISRDLGTGAASVQLTLTSFMIGLAGGQLLLGPLSDRWGRRRVLRIALTVFAACSIAITFTPNIELFIALRGLQGIAGAGGIVLSRAIIADLEKGISSVRALSFLAMLTSLAPIVAPLAGGVTAERFGWRAVLGVLAVLGIAMFALAWRFVPETLPVEQRQSGGMLRSAHNFRRLLSDARFMSFALVISFAFGGLLGYVAASPFVGQTILGMNQTQYSLAFAASALAIVSGTSLNGRLAGRVDPARMLLLGTALLSTGAIAFAVQVFTGTLTIPGLIIAAFVLSSGIGFVMPNAQALGLARADYARGSGSALLGAFQFFSGAITSPLVGAWGEHTAVPMVLVLLITSGLAFACALAVVLAGRGPRRGR